MREGSKTGGARAQAPACACTRACTGACAFTCACACQLACILPIEEYVSEELRDDLLSPERCLLPADQWPAYLPKSSVHATDDEWYSIVKHAARGVRVRVGVAVVVRLVWLAAAE